MGARGVLGMVTSYDCGNRFYGRQRTILVPQVTIVWVKAKYKW